MEKEKIIEEKSIKKLIYDLVLTFILPLGGVLIALITVYFDNYGITNDSDKEALKVWMILIGVILGVGVIAAIVLAFWERIAEINLSSSEKSVNNSQKQARSFLNANVKTIEKGLKKIWNNKLPYKNLSYKDLDLYSKLKNEDNNGTKNKIIEKIKKTISDNNNENKLKRVLKKPGVKDDQVRKNQLVCETLYNLQRILLEMGEYKIRERIGFLLIKYSNDINHLAAAYIDFLGWTYMLSGTDLKAAKGEKYINNGINLLNYYLNNCSPDEVQKIKLLLARAYRHLGTTRYVIRKKYNTEKANNIKENLDKALDELKDVDQNSQDYKRMKAGIDYNNFLIKYNNHMNQNEDLEKKYLDIEEIKNNLLKCFEMNPNEKAENNIGVQLQKNNAFDPHRKIKVLSLLADIDFRLMLNEKKNVEKAKLEKEINYCLKGVEEILKENIYFDEGMEKYLEQKFERLCYELNKKN